MLSTHTLASVSKQAPSAPPTQVLIAYAVFLSLAFAVYHWVALGEFSALLTMSAILQCLAFALLVVQVLLTGRATGISGRALALDALALCCRLSSTTWLQGYLPVDASGDWVYQAVDVCSLGLVGWLLYELLSGDRGRASYQADADSCPVLPLVVAAVILAAFLHASMNARPIFDTLWMAGLFISVIAVLPQLWLIARTGGQVESLTSHYIAAVALSRALAGIFMWEARLDIVCNPWLDGVNHAIWAILAAHVMHLLLLGDFAYHYVRAVVRNGLAAKLDLCIDLGV